MSLNTPPLMACPLTQLPMACSNSLPMLTACLLSAPTMVAKDLSSERMHDCKVRLLQRLDAQASSPTIDAIPAQQKNTAVPRRLILSHNRKLCPILRVQNASFPLITLRLSTTTALHACIHKISRTKTNESCTSLPRTRSCTVPRHFEGAMMVPLNGRSGMYGEQKKTRDPRRPGIA